MVEAALKNENNVDFYWIYHHYFSVHANCKYYFLKQIHHGPEILKEMGKDDIS